MVFVLLQMWCFISLLPSIDSESSELSQELISNLLFTFVEPTAADTAPETDEDAMNDAESLAPPPLSPPLTFRGGLKRPASVIAVAIRASHELAVSAKRKANDARFAWTFKQTTRSREEVTLHGCLGNGTYGAVLNASIRPLGPQQEATFAVAKIPVLRTWGFKFFSAELNALDAISRLNANHGAGVRNVIGFYGNVTISISELLHHLDSDGRAASDGLPTRWRCLNRTDLRNAQSLHHIQKVPALLLERLQPMSLFKVFATLAAPSAKLSVTAQHRFFTSQFKRAISGPNGVVLLDALRHAVTLFIGAARGLAALSRAQVLHRDLSEPGKNVLLQQDSVGITAKLIDFSQAEVCAPSQGNTARAVELYAFGNLLYFACYGKVIHSLPWAKHSCRATFSPALLGLLAAHRSAHPGGRIAPHGLASRCHDTLRAPLDYLMRFCWAPALGAGIAAEAATVDRTGAAEIAAKVLLHNHTWPMVIKHLEALRGQHVPLMRGL